MNFVKREILPVGQGAFYLETLRVGGKRYRVIYDCGSATDVTYVEDQIRKNFVQGAIIDAVFISHLDDDHVNGLEFLLKHCRVRHLFFPLITSEMQELNELMNVINEKGSSSFASRFISTNGRSLEDSDLTLHPISVENQEEGLIAETSAAIFGSGVENEWVYLPHNFREKGRYRDFISNIAEVNSKLSNGGILDGDKIDLEKLKHLWNQGTTQDKIEIKEAYRKVPGSLNVNSMTLYSGTRRKTYCRCCCRYYPRCCRECFEIPYYFENLRLNGCLYTGDYDFGRTATSQKWKSICSVYEKYFTNVGLVQIPHHGSKYNYNSKLRDVTRYAVYFTSAGLNNSYGHPHSEAVRDLSFNGKIFNCVTESKHSKMTYTTRWCD